MYHMKDLLFFIFNFLEEMSPFCGATDTPVLQRLLVTSPLGFKARVDPSLACFLACAQQIPERLTSFKRNALKNISNAFLTEDID